MPLFSGAVERSDTCLIAAYDLPADSTRPVSYRAGRVVLRPHRKGCQPTMDQTSVFAPIFKSSEQDDGTLMIYGKATGSDLDLDGQRCDPEWLKRAMPEWFKIGNVRSQHDPKLAVGKATEHEVKEDGHYIKAHIVDPLAIAKTKAGVFTGLSIGIMKPRLEKSAEGEWIRDGLIGEVSLCDRPCLPTATFTMCKTATPGMEVNASDFDEGRGLVKCAELTLSDAADVVEKTVTVPSPLNMPGAKRPAQAVTAEVVKATNVAELDAPNHSQTCVRCAEPGHLWCAPEGFDKDFAVGVVNETLEKAASPGDGLGQDETGDISGAEQAITAVANLIISEAQALANMPAQDCDIHLLMAAVDALRLFSMREKLEQGAIDPDSMVCLSATPDATKKSKYNAAQMAAMLKNGEAMANANGDPSYPIADADDLEKAIHAVGRGKGDKSAIRAHIIKRAKALGKASMLPDSWTADDTGKSVTPDVAKGRTVTIELDGKSYTATLNDVPDDVEKTVAPDEAPEPVEVEKAATVESPVETEEVDTTKSTASDAIKSLTGEIAELRELVKSLSSNDTTVKALETTQVTLGDISARLEQVEKMATPGGPALRRTDVEVRKSRQSDLLLQAEVEERKASATHDNDLRQGYLTKASDLRAEAQALAA